LFWVVVLVYGVAHTGLDIHLYTAVITMAPVRVLVLLPLPSVKNFYLQSIEINPIRLNPR